MPQSYGVDLAYIHDLGFSSYSLNAAPGILRHLRENDADRGLVIDLGCGSGILARQLGFAGYHVLGIDSSASMIRIARRRAPAAQFVRASLLDADLPRCSAVLSIGEVLSFAFAGSDESELDPLFRSVYKALLPGGIFLFDFGQTGVHPGGMPRKGFWTGKDWTVLVEVVPSDSEPQILKRRLTSFRKVGTLYRRREEIHRLRLFSSEAVVARLRRTGFDVKLLRSFGDLRFRSGHAGVFARKP
jgi:SAM-dependent methyltransferase